MYKYYVHKIEFNKISMIVFSISFTFSFYVIILFSFKNLGKQINENISLLSIMSFVLYITLFIPYSYFYSEEIRDDYYVGYSFDKENKVIKSMKYTIMSILVLMSIILALVFIKFDIYINGTLQLNSLFSVSFSLIKNVFKILGFLVLSLYLPYGSARLPLFLISFNISKQEKQMGFKNIEESIKSKILKLEEKKKKAELSVKEQNLLDSLIIKEKALKISIYKLDELIDNEAILYKCLNLLYPFKFLIGLVFIVIGICLFLTISSRILEGVSN